MRVVEMATHLATLAALGFVSSTSLSTPTPYLPSWTAPLPDKALPLAGYSYFEGVKQVEVYHGNEKHGTYNHAAMIDYKNDAAGRFLLMWKNCLYSEDCTGQRILYSQSDDGASWTTTDGSNVLFPNMSTDAAPTALFVGPTVRINGRQFAAASPGVVNPKDGNAAAQGAQFCLWPDAIDARDCGPPGQKQYKSTLLLREVLPEKMGSLGDIFWAEGTAPPKQFAKASKRLGIKMLSEMDQQTQVDVSTMLVAARGPNPENSLCAPKSDGTLKCEVCADCQKWDDLSRDGFTNERTHWKLRDGGDIIGYRAGQHIWASSRALNSSQWTPPSQTDIPNDSSNLNAGSLPGGKTYIVHNPLWNWTDSEEAFTGFASPSPGPPDKPRKPRDPLTVAISNDGLVFDRVGVVMSCTTLSAESRCGPRFGGRAKNPGPSYPQAVTVIDPAPKELQGLYVVATNNKEDVWVSHVPYSSLGVHETSIGTAVLV